MRDISTDFLKHSNTLEFILAIKQNNLKVIVLQWQRLTLVQCNIKQKRDAKKKLNNINISKEAISYVASRTLEICLFSAECAYFRSYSFINNERATRESERKKEKRSHKNVEQKGLECIFHIISFICAFHTKGSPYTTFLRTYLCYFSLPFYLFRIVAHFYFVTTLLVQFILKVCKWKSKKKITDDEQKHCEYSKAWDLGAPTIENLMTWNILCVYMNVCVCVYFMTSSGKMCSEKQKFVFEHLYCLHLMYFPDASQSEFELNNLLSVILFFL